MALCTYSFVMPFCYLYDSMSQSETIFFLLSSIRASDADFFEVEEGQLNRDALAIFS